MDFTKNTYLKGRNMVTNLFETYSGDDNNNNNDDGLSLAAIVNDEKITQVELDSKYNKLPEQYQAMMTKEDLLDQMINEILLLEEAKDVRISDKEVDEVLEEMMLEGGVSKEELNATLAAQGITMKELKANYKKQLIINKFINDTLFQDLTVSDSEIEKYYEKNSEVFIAEEGQVRTSHILVATEKEAKEVYADVTTGKDFAEVAKEKSTGPRASVGGDLGFVKEGELVEEFATILFALDENEISQPVQTNYGWHVIKRENDEISLEEAHDQIENVLLSAKQQSVLETFIEQLKSSATITYSEEAKVTEKEVVETSLAECLKDSKLYIIKDSKFCEEQVKLLGKDIANINVIDCGVSECNVEGYPTWEINNEQYPGMKSTQELKELASC